MNSPDKLSGRLLGRVSLIMITERQKASFAANNAHMQKVNAAGSSIIALNAIPFNVYCEYEKAEMPPKNIPIVQQIIGENMTPTIEAPRVKNAVATAK